ncbi:unnamed protein product [Bursaphelenchus okinawaensis]|uniref:DNA topoisomerase 2 n=1 Tax=Bursaphelenchus okinawaensis TaxID=465554 RepID=A0A811KSC2_9BILA|nr:unnamed protein product [Bursaphelenchus okinawaensis]CAG9110848.1 unnamed protein product [Bursaphelenchus okinawaensis]
MLRNPLIFRNVFGSLSKPIYRLQYHLYLPKRTFSSEEFGDETVAEVFEEDVEQQYQRKTQLEHILLRPDTYIGSVEFCDRTLMWIYDMKEKRLVNKPISFVPGLYKIFDEILVNAADNRRRDKRMNKIEVDIDKDRNRISILNNGRGVPVVWHKKEEMYIPELIFGTLLTSSNYDDKERKTTGGRNGFGAKLCNIFSKEFTLETSFIENGKSFRQSWTNNMTQTTSPEIEVARSEDYTKVTFTPDLQKFGMKVLDDEIIGLMARRALDISATTKGVKVTLNGEVLAINTFHDYMNLFFEDESSKTSLIYDHNRRWQVGIGLSNRGFQQMSFVNSVWTVRGGRHVDYVVEQIVDALMEELKPKMKRKGIQLKAHQIKNNLFVFVNSLIENPAFDSQTKETLTTKPKLFGSEWKLEERMIKKVLSAGIIEASASMAKKKQMERYEKANVYVRTAQIDVPKLVDANEAGTSRSSKCTLILTEGDSAKSLAIAGLSALGQDKYGVFSLRGKMLNVRKGRYQQVLENSEVNALIKILGLEYKRTYESEEERANLRYGKIMIMTDQDEDGSHIKGLIINFIHHNWPELLKHNFIEQFITPIVKATKGNESTAFYSMAQYLQWQKNTEDWNTYKIKYYKGLGTSTSKEAKEYFNNLERHQVQFEYSGQEDDANLELAFSKDRVEDRKTWITEYMNKKKSTETLEEPEDVIYDINQRSLTFSEFINKELIVFSNADNVRNIPNLIDGLKPVQRKVIFTCFKRYDKKQLRVQQLASAVGELTAYHHGDKALLEAIIGMAQNFVGSNNINLLVPHGQFGTRLEGGKDSASARYLYTQLSPITRYIFPQIDDQLLRPKFDLDEKVEPIWYVPIVPVALINGVMGVGTGWCSKIPNFKPEDVVKNIKRLIKSKPMVPMEPWFKNFKGTMFKLNDRRYLSYGEIIKINNSCVEITELPIKVWTQHYKEQVLEQMLKDNIIESFKEYHTESTVKFVVRMNTKKLFKARKIGLHKVFRLRSMMSLNTMVLFDVENRIRFYDSPEEILKEFFEVRKQYYIKRRKFVREMIEAEVKKGGISIEIHENETE